MRILEDANIKLSSVLSKVNGVSGERIVEALLSGQTDTERLASLCHWRIKADKEEVMLALEGKLTDHHKFMLRIIRKDIAKTEALIAELDLEIAQQLEPYAKEMTLLQERFPVSAS